MVTETVQSYEAMSAIGASLIFADADAMKRIAKGERYNLGLATGNTMITLYEELADKFNRAKADLSLLVTWNLDEYASDAHTAVGHDHPLSYWKYTPRRWPPISGGIPTLWQGRFYSGLCH